MPERISLQLTEHQRAVIRAACGADGDALELTIEELEERIAPSAPIRFVAAATGAADALPAGATEHGALTLFDDNTAVFTGNGTTTVDHVLDRMHDLDGGAADVPGPTAPAGDAAAGVGDTAGSAADAPADTVPGDVDQPASLVEPGNKLSDGLSSSSSG